MNKHVSSNFDELLREDGVLEEVTAVAIKRVISWQLAEAMKSQGINKTELAERMHTPNATTREAIAELESGKGKRFASVDDLMADLNADD